MSAERDTRDSREASTASLAAVAVILVVSALAAPGEQVIRAAPLAADDAVVDTVIERGGRRILAKRRTAAVAGRRAEGWAVRSRREGDAGAYGRADPGP